ARRLGDTEIAGWAGELEEMLDRLAGLTDAFAGRDFDDDLAAGAVDYQSLFGLVSLGWMWLRILTARPAEPPPRSDRDFARSFFLRVLPEGMLHARLAEAGSKDLMAPPAEIIGTADD